MKNKKWISLAAAVVLAVTALPMGVFAAKKDSTEEKLTSFMHHSMWQSKRDILKMRGWI